MENGNITNDPLSSQNQSEPDDDNQILDLGGPVPHRITVSHDNNLPLSSTTNWRKIISLTLIGLVIILALGAGYKLLRPKNDQPLDTANSPVTPTQYSPTATLPDNPTQPSNNQPSASTPTAPSSGQVTNCGVAGMPAGVCDTINSVEKDGVKNNPYIEADTSQLPSNTTAEVNKHSWKQTDSNNGTIDFVLNVAGSKYNGSAILQNKNGTWKIVSYTSS
jgi:hypothetical protein